MEVFFVTFQLAIPAHFAAVKLLLSLHINYNYKALHGQQICKSLDEEDIFIFNIQTVTATIWLQAQYERMITGYYSYWI